MSEAKNSATNLIQCQEKAINTPGCIQPHGLLIVLQEPDLQIIQLSNNFEQHLGIITESLLNKNLDFLVGQKQFNKIKKTLESENLASLNPFSIKLVREGEILEFCGYFNRTFQGLILELEIVESEKETSLIQFYKATQTAIHKLKTGLNYRNLCQIAAQEIRKLSGFDRVMVYRFNQDWHGEVIAEDKIEDIESYFGLHFPAADIPPLARNLFELQPLRFIPDVHYKPVKLIPLNNPLTAQPLDLSYSILRGVSPIHIEYLSNMAIQGSMTISLLKNNQLWGLIACHHKTPKFVTQGVRSACEIFGKVLSMTLSDTEDNEDYKYQIEMKSIQAKLIELMSQENNFVNGLVEYQPNILDLFEAKGAAIYNEGKCYLLGITPNAQDIEQIVKWIKTTSLEHIFFTDSLSSVYPEAKKYQKIASGVLAISLSKSSPKYVLWFRPEVIQSINWAGKPDQLIEIDRDYNLHPRQSFKLWKEQVSGKSLAWKNIELNAALELRNSILEVGLWKADDLMNLNAELARSNHDLDAFAYIASHDLKEPLRGIHNYANFMLEDYENKLEAEAIKQLKSITRLTQRMDALLDSLLHFSRVGRVELSIKNIDLNKIVADTLEMLKPRLDGQNIKILIPSPLPIIQGDPIRIGELYSNLISNAIKYNDKEQKWIEIGFIDAEELLGKAWKITGEQAPHPARIFYIKDNGIGIREKHQNAIFQIFKRLHGKEQYGGGTGIGLTITKKIVERHGGKIWIDSTYGQGTTFYFTLPG